MSKNDLGVKPSLQLCPICADEVNGPENITSEEKKARYDSFKGQIMWVKPCVKCEEMKKKGFVLIGAVESKTKDATNPYRSGNVWCVTMEVAKDLFKPYPPPESGVAFVDIIVAKQMNLPDVNMDA